MLANAVLLAAALISGCEHQVRRQSSEAERTRPLKLLQLRPHIVLLGTGTPNPDPHHHGPSLAVIVGGEPHIVDCGAGVVRRAASAFARGVRGLEVSGLGRLFITHLHSDHTLGYTDLIHTPWNMGRRQPLKVVGPPGTARMTRHLVAAYEEDVQVRINGLQPVDPGGHEVEVRDLPTGPAGRPSTDVLAYRKGGLRVVAFAVRHGIWQHAYGYRFETPEVHICVSGDTRPFTELAARYAGCDILVHEAYSRAGFLRRPAAWQRYHAASHTSAVELGRIAARVRPRLLILTHLLAWRATEEELVAEVRIHYPGPVKVGRDLTLVGLSGDFSRGTGDRLPRGTVQVLDLGPPSASHEER